MKTKQKERPPVCLAGFFSLLKRRGASRYNSCPDEIVGGSVIDED
jgi:hypothetical protein